MTNRRASRLTVAVVGLAVTLLCVIGADCLWAVTLGEHIAATGRIDEEVYFASAPTAGWHNVPVLGELILAAAYSLGLSGLILLNAVAVIAAFALTVVDGRRAGVSDRAQAIAMAIAALGILPDLMVIRLGLLSLPAFGLLLVVLRSQHRLPTRRIWWVPVLIAIWGNLHGAVLVGLALTGIYLLLSRLRRAPIESVLVGGGCLLAVFANPQGLNTWVYYRGVMDNVARSRGTGLWAPLNFSTPFQLLLVGAVALLLVAAIRARPAIWEQCAILVLAIAVVTAARYGVWLALLLIVPASSGLTSAWPRQRSGEARSDDRVKKMVDQAVIAASVLAMVGGSVNRGLDAAPVPTVVRDTTSRLADGAPILANDRASEALALSGAQVVVADPIDAFTKADQLAYVEFLDGKNSSLIDRARVILAAPHDAFGRGLPGGFRVAQTIEAWRILVRTEPAQERH